MVLGWSIIAFSVVFRPANRALFFTETLSIILLLRFVLACPDCFDSLWQFVSYDNQKALHLKGKFVIIILLFAFFLVDAGRAIKETSRQKENNNKSLERIVEANGFAAVDVFPSSHRMAIEPSYPSWSWEGIANQFGLDTVRVYPYYCLDKYYSDSIYNGKVFVDQLGLLGYGDISVRDQGMVFVRNENSEDAGNHSAVITISYLRPRKWYIVMVERLRGYDYNRSSVVEKKAPDLSFAGYDYYVIWMKKENLKGLKNVEIKID